MVKFQQRSPDPFFYPGGKTGILLIHGFTGTPSELRPMGEYFRTHGYTVSAPLLPGHGTTPEDLKETHWKDWWHAVEEAYHLLHAGEVENVYAVGLSMGASLALYLASFYPVSGVVSLCAPIWLRDRRAHFVQVYRWFQTYHHRASTKLPEIEKHLLPYDRTPLDSIAELMHLIRQVKERLPQVKVPALIIQSQLDETVMPKSANYIYDHIGSENKTLSWYERSSHLITLDRERRRLFTEVEEFIKRTSGFQ